MQNSKDIESFKVHLFFIFFVFIIVIFDLVPRRGCSSHGMFNIYDGENIDEFRLIGRAVDSHGRRKIRQVRRSIL